MTRKIPPSPSASTPQRVQLKDHRADRWLECKACGSCFPLNSRQTSCDACGGDWLDARYNYAVLGRDWRKSLSKRPFDSIWRYRELLRDEIAQTVTTEEQIDQEIRDLFTALAR